MVMILFTRTSLWIDPQEFHHIAPENFDCREDTFKPQPVEETVKVQLGLEKTQTISTGSLMCQKE